MKPKKIRLVVDFDPEELEKAGVTTISAELLVTKLAKKHATEVQLLCLDEKGEKIQVERFGG